MPISTIFYFVRKIVGKNRVKNADKLIVDGISESFEPSKESINRIMSFSDAYCYDKSESIGDVEYLIN